MTDQSSENGRSYVCYTENETRIMKKLDEMFKEKALSLGGKEYHIPALIDKAVLQKCGYFTSFPQQLTMAAYAKPDLCKQIASTNEVNDSMVNISSQYFTPVACLHIYPMLAGQDIVEEIITTKARVYRYEKEFDGKTRLWDFTVREIVFAGKEEFVLSSLAEIKKFTLTFLTLVGLPADIIEATDNFYPTKINNIKKKIQLSNSQKYELRTLIDPKKVALASFNYHNTHFSKPFKFDQKGEIVTGCVGFGLERWITALNHYNITF